MTEARITSFAHPEAEAFRVQVRKWLNDSLPTDWRALEVTLSEDEMMDIRRDWDKTLYAAGYAGLSWPTKFGGRDAGPVLDVIFHEELARAHAPEGLGRIGRIMAGPLIMRYGTDDQRERFLPPILEGRQVWCLGYSEPHAGSDLAAATTTAVWDGDVYQLHGRKVWTSHAHYADRCVLLARSSLDRPRYSNMTMFLLDLHQPGIDVSPIITAAGDHHFNEVTFDGAVIAAEDRLGPEHEGWAVFRGSLAFERGVAPALNHYIEMCRELDVLTDCCVHATPDPAANQFTQSLSIEIELIRWHILRVTELDSNERDSHTARMVLKLYWSELWQRLTDFGLRLACRQHLSYWRYQYLQSRAATIYAGTSEIQRNTIARRVLAQQQPAGTP